MTNRILAGLGVAVFSTALAGADDAVMSVYFAAANVTPRTEVDDATKNALKKKRDDASKARQALEKQLKQQLGKKRETWPEDKDEELYKLEEQEVLAIVDYEYRKIDPKAIADAVEDMAGAAQGKGAFKGRKDHIKVAASAAEADLVVEVLARRSQKQFGAVVPSDCWVLFTLGAGGHLDPARFAQVPASYRPRKVMMSAWKVAGPNAEKPVFTFEGWNGGGTPVSCHGEAANQASGLIDKFIVDNHALLSAQ